MCAQEAFLSFVMGRWQANAAVQVGGSRWGYPPVAIAKHNDPTAYRSAGDRSI
jgi:hypothetical protein